MKKIFGLVLVFLFVQTSHASGAFQCAFSTDNNVPVVAIHPPFEKPTNGILAGERSTTIKAPTYPIRDLAFEKCKLLAQKSESEGFDAPNWKTVAEATHTLENFVYNTVKSQNNGYVLQCHKIPVNFSWTGSQFGGGGGLSGYYVEIFGLSPQGLWERAALSLFNSKNWSDEEVEGAFQKCNQLIKQASFADARSDAYSKMITKNAKNIASQLKD